jgi:phage terminase small subunit
MSALIEQRPDAPPAKREKSAYEQLKRREQRFVDYYVCGKSAAECMRLVNKSLRPDSCRVMAHRLLQRDDIRAAIRERTAEAIHDAGAAIVEVVRHQAACATSDASKLANPDGTHKAPHELDEQTRLAVRSFDIEEVSTGGRTGTRYKYQLWDKGKAGEFIGKTLGYIQAPASTVNVDARSVTVNNGGGDAALRAVSELQQRLADIARRAGASIPHQDGPVLPAEGDHGAGGHGAPLDVRPDQGSGGGA